MIATARISRYLSHATPKAVHDPFAPDVDTIEYRGHRIVVELVSAEFVRAHVLDPTGLPLAEICSAVTAEGAIALGKMTVDRLLGDA